jgi:hypothetical protein
MNAPLFKSCLLFAAIVTFVGLPVGVEQAIHSGLPPGIYGGAGQEMIIGSDGKVSFRDNLGIRSIKIEPDDSLKADFPSKNTFMEIHLQLSGMEPRATWTARAEDTTYKVTAVPFSEEAYVFRLEILRGGKLIGGEQQFYAICKPKKVP